MCLPACDYAKWVRCPTCGPKGGVCRVRACVEACHGPALGPPLCSWGTLGSEGPIYIGLCNGYVTLTYVLGVLQCACTAPFVLPGDTSRVSGVAGLHRYDH